MKKENKRMTFLDEINNAKKEQMNVNEAITTEIVDWFITRLNSKEFEDGLKKQIINDIKGNTETKILVEFWEYHPGCSPTSFRVGSLTWDNGYGYDSWFYKGVELECLCQDITIRIIDALRNKLHELGLMVKVEDATSNYRFGYPHYVVHIQV